MLCKVGSIDLCAMGIRSVNRKFKMMGSLAVVVAVTKTQYSESSWDVFEWAFTSHTKDQEKILSRYVDKLYR